VKNLESSGFDSGLEGATITGEVVELDGKPLGAGEQGAAGREKFELAAFDVAFEEVDGWDVEKELIY